MRLIFLIRLWGLSITFIVYINNIHDLMVARKDMKLVDGLIRSQENWGYMHL